MAVDKIMMNALRAAARTGYKQNAPRAPHQAGVALCNTANGMMAMDGVVEPDHSATLQAIAEWIASNCSDDEINEHISALQSRGAQDSPSSFQGMPSTKTAQDMAFDLRYPGASHIRVGDAYGQQPWPRSHSMSSAEERDFEERYPGTSSIKVL